MFQAIAALSLVAVSLAAKCDSPKTTSSSYSTTDAFFHFHTTFVVEFSLSCANNFKETALFAVVDNNEYLVANAEESNKYQVTWHLDNDKASARTFTVNIYDEEGIAAYRKNSATKPIVSIEHFHAGLSKKPLISSETVGALISFGLVGVAYKLRSQLLN